jgi:presenilin-like A22 family membrane protease
MAQDAVVIEHPNREKAESRATKAIVVALLLVSAVIMLIVTVGGWHALQGAKSLQVGYVVVYVVLALQIGRWRSGLLPVAAALAIVLLIFAAISGPQWFARDKNGFADPTLDESVLGLLTVVLVPLQLLLIVVAARGFSQKWSVEVERSAAPGPHAAQPA